MHQPNLYYNQLQEDVAGLLTGDKDYLAFFCNSGAEANEAAIKIARKASGKQEIITFQNSFHGRTFGSMSATGQDKIKQGFGEGVPHFSYAIFNDMDSVKALANKETSAIMLELVQGESGVQPADKAFVKALSDYCQETGIYPVSYTHLDVYKRQKFYNTTYVYNKSGDLINIYSKVHLFGLMAEDQYMSAGAAESIFELDGVIAASVICYDIRFPCLLYTSRCV